MSKPAQPIPIPPFEGFRPECMAFFRDLDNNQNKEWFAANKARYEQFARGPLKSLVVDTSTQLKKHKLPLYGDPQRSLFRINRDIRFSKDKRPYQTHASAVLTRDGEKHSPGVLYVHIDPAGSFVAAGFYCPEPPMLLALRQGLVAQQAGWGKVERALLKADLPLATDETLVRVPRGFEDVSPKLAEVLKLKNWVVRRELSATDISRPSLVDQIVALARDAKPLLNFGWDALIEVERG
ncbi:MAG: DUF2461 domain-containing protein [Schlesneria sp.]